MVDYTRRDEDRVRDLLATGISNDKFPGAVAVVGGRDFAPITVAAGERNPTRELPVTVETRFDCASLTKPVVTTTLVLQLLEDGELTLDDTLGDHVAELADSERAEVSVRSLITHTSGFQPYLYDESWDAPGVAKDAVLGRDVVERPVGEAFEYSCLNFVHLQFVVESVTGRSLAGLAAERIFEPVGMTATVLGPDRLDDGPVAATYDHEWDDRPLHRTTHDPLARALGGYAGNAGLFSTAGDLERFARTLLARGTEPDSGSRILSPAVVELLPEERARSEDVSQGYGWRTGTARTPAPTWSDAAIGHTGFTGTSLWIDLEREWYAVLLTNAEYHGSDMNRFRTRFHTVAASIASERQSGRS